MAASAIEVDAATKTYRGTRALDGVTLRIAPGEVVALLGPNGAGKTTLVSLMLGLRRPTTGGVRLFGADPRDPHVRSRCGVMLQESGVPLFLRVGEIVDLFRSYYPRPLPRDEAIRAAGLEDKATALLISLSGGQLQRLYYALAICGDPEALFLDEPTVGMDVAARASFWRSMRDFAARGRTVLLTTHYLDEADAIAGRIIVIDKGVVVADDTPAALKAKVETKRVSFDPLPSAMIDGLPGKLVETRDGRTTLLTSAPEELLRALFARGAAVRNLEVVGASLEEAVTNLTSAGRS